MKKKESSGIREYLRSIGVRQFIIRSAILAFILLGSYLFVFLYFRHTPFFIKYLRLGEQFYFPFLTGLRKTDFLNAVLFTGLIFLIWNRAELLKIKPYRQEIRQTLIFAFLAALMQLFHYSFKYSLNFFTVPESFYLPFTVLKYSLNVLFVIFTAIAVFNLEFFRIYLKKFRYQLPVFSLVLVAYFFIIQLFQNIWYALGNFVAHTIYSMLSLTFKEVFYSPGTGAGPRLGVGNFIVGISKECSGIDSLLLFISLYTVLLVLDWNRMNRKRMLILFPIGILMTVAYNLLRVYLIMLVGIFYNPRFAIDVFHTNAGWILFLGFFIVFWHFGSSWVYLKKVK